MQFWCSTIEVPWTWNFRAYPGIWAMVVLISLPYLMAMRRRQGPNSDTSAKTRFFLAGVLVFWVATDWPLGLLGASYLASAHMVQYLLYTLVAAPLMLLGVPEWMARQMLGRPSVHRTALRLSRPVTAGVVFNLTLIFTHSPWAVDTLRSTQFGSFAMDIIWLLSGFVLWILILSPLPEMTGSQYPVKMAYLFLAAGVVPAIPGGFLTFATFPLYSTYELAPRFHSLAADTDQQIAGLVMKLGGIPIVWGTMLAMMMKWMAEPREAPVPTIQAG
ncbi:MAG: cytochrome c oxidase assembly protein [Ilumatobacter sp.]|nr:cytochrome c oxidase assembly protein [Ilumatobacter sp.]